MKRRFNITGSCNPERHYMIRLDDRIKKIKEKYVDDGSYFVINKGRQYGKTTTLSALERYLKDEFEVLSLDFQQISTGMYPCFSRRKKGPCTDHRSAQSPSFRFIQNYQYSSQSLLILVSASI